MFTETEEKIFNNVVVEDKIIVIETTVNTYVLPSSVSKRYLCGLVKKNEDVGVLTIEFYGFKYDIDYCLGDKNINELRVDLVMLIIGDLRERGVEIIP
jgi:hypothetical protein